MSQCTRLTPCKIEGWTSRENIIKILHVRNIEKGMSFLVKFEKCMISLIINI